MDENRNGGTVLPYPRLPLTAYYGIRYATPEEKRLTKHIVKTERYIALFFLNHICIKIWRCFLVFAVSIRSCIFVTICQQNNWTICLFQQNFRIDNSYEH